MMQAALPEPFRDLEPYLDWSLPTERERRDRRLASSMDEIEAFHSVMSERLEEIVVYLNQYPYAELPADAARLCDMSLALIEVSNLVEMYKNPAIMSAMDPNRFLSYE